MKNGIYHVNFRSGSQTFGEGLVVIKDNTVNGGDVGYLYSGIIEHSSNGVSSELLVRKWNPQVTSVFGPINEFTLNLEGSFDANASTFSVNGTAQEIAGATITISGRWLSEAA
ncbi:hypothetical protein QEH56_21105 [Pelagicoccus enzymogenes]|uniref:GrlR family regulatory protein n=1 Tax=Pelagicoccus enzymogenes TaxID=2773457 RepID=UPI00280C95F6|nr:GrlR family regulatory protein [Pelagicoccus enzymogenes]MDQ8200679.1 hypothetical protein [Pelagicoccus enzymogenes]